MATGATRSWPVNTGLVILAVALSASPGLRAQVFDSRMTAMWVDLTTDTFVSAGIDDRTVLQWRWPSQSSVLQNGQMAVAGEIGSILRVGASRYLIGVWDQANLAGLILQADVVAGSGVTVGTLTVCHMPSRRPSSMLLVDDRLFVYDHATGCVLSGGWVPGQPLVMSEIITGQQIPAQAAKDRLNLRAFDSGVSLAHEELDPNPDPLVYRLHESTPGVWAVAPFHVPTQGPAWRLGPVFVAETQVGYDLQVHGGQGLFGVRRVADGVIVAVGDHTQPSDQGQSCVVPWSMLSYGASYDIVSLQGQACSPSVSWVAMPRWRRVVETGSVKSAGLNVRWDYPSSQEDYVGWTLAQSGAVAAPGGVFVATMFVGDWQMGVDPTAVVAGLPILANAYGDLGFQFRSFDNTGVVSVAYTFNVNNPIFTGYHVAFHCGALLPNGEFVTSDVAGVVLQ